MSRAFTGAHTGSISPGRSAPASWKQATLGDVRGGLTDGEPPRPAVAMPTRFLRWLATVHPLSCEERAALQTVWGPRTEIAADTDLMVEGQEVRRGYIFEEGWTCRYRLLKDGRRQILNFGVPGDFIGALGESIGIADHSVATLTRCRVHAFRSAKFSEVRRRFPALQPVFDWSARRDRAMIQERIVDIGRRTARERVAHLLLELMHRLRFVGLCNGRGFDLPLTQEMIGDALGLSIVHVNRTLRRLNGEALIRYRPGRIDMVDEAGLARMAGFDAEYLHQSDLFHEAGHGLSAGHSLL